MSDHDNSLRAWQDRLALDRIKCPGFELSLGKDIGGLHLNIKGVTQPLRGLVMDGINRRVDLLEFTLKGPDAEDLPHIDDIVARHTQPLIERYEVARDIMKDVRGEHGIMSPHRPMRTAWVDGVLTFLCWDRVGERERERVLACWTFAADFEPWLVVSLHRDAVVDPLGERSFTITEGQTVPFWSSAMNQARESWREAVKKDSPRPAHAAKIFAASDLQAYREFEESLFGVWKHDLGWSR